jgi:hypothetical protein
MLLTIIKTLHFQIGHILFLIHFKILVIMFSLIANLIHYQIHIEIDFIKKKNASLQKRNVFKSINLTIRLYPFKINHVANCY